MGLSGNWEDNLLLLRHPLNGWQLYEPRESVCGFLGTLAQHGRTAQWAGTGSVGRSRVATRRLTGWRLCMDAGLALGMATFLALTTAPVTMPGAGSIKSDIPDSSVSSSPGDRVSAAWSPRVGRVLAPVGGLCPPHSCPLHLLGPTPTSISSRPSEGQCLGSSHGPFCPR